MQDTESKTMFAEFILPHGHRQGRCIGPNSPGFCMVYGVSQKVSQNYQGSRFRVLTYQDKSMWCHYCGFLDVGNYHILTPQIEFQMRTI